MVSGELVSGEWRPLLWGEGWGEGKINHLTN